jgi:integrase
VAIKRGLVHANPAQHVEVVAHARPAVHVWDAPTTGRFLDATSGTPYGALWHLIASFGLRRGEAAGLRWSHIDLDLGVAVIAYSARRSARTSTRRLPRPRPERER